MRLYQQQHQTYCGVDLHARTMYLCVLDPQGNTLLHQDLPATTDVFLAAIKPHRQGLVVACEGMFAWYWLADLCDHEGIPTEPGWASQTPHEGRQETGKAQPARRPNLGSFIPSIPPTPSAATSSPGPHREDGPPGPEPCLETIRFVAQITGATIGTATEPESNGTRQGA